MRATMSSSQHITFIRPKIGQGYTDAEWGAITKFIEGYYEVVTEMIDMEAWLVCETCQGLEGTIDCKCEEE